jgi:hypothetical protein
MPTYRELMRFKQLSMRSTRRRLTSRSTAENSNSVRTVGGTIGLLSIDVAQQDGAAPTTVARRRESSTDDLDGLYVTLQERGVPFAEPSHDEP